ncbi:hypothetical protein AVEN_59710-1 [Araneus ventricosus]|uniref:Uncharacterized protein n=1 Tax=Araneus ventricosus TaxID=182803 RepID=A0A4Y2BMQ2_ARAVE|nr:hypothetical protein AVEN_59710-1 [Araneus ventricosus]
MDILVRNVCDDETRAFTSRCVWLIALRYQIRESLKRKLERIPVLSNHLNECCREARLMRRMIVYGKFTLYDFALGCFQARVEDPVREIYIPLVEILLSGLCRKYFELIFCCLSLPDLRRVLEITAGNWFSLDTLLPDASNFTLFDAIGRFYDENFQLKRRLRRVKASLMKIV